MYRSFYEAIKKLPESERLIAYDRLMEYAINWNDTGSEWLSDIIFWLMKPNIDANNERFNIGSKQWHHWIKGWRPRKNKNPDGDKIKTPMGLWNETPNVNVNVNVNDNVDDKKKKFVPPSISDVEKYFVENWYKKEVAVKAFEFYNSAKRVDSQWKKVRNRKQKMIGVWFKEENKDTPIVEPPWEKEKWELYVQIGRKKYIELFGLEKAVEANKFKNIYWLTDLQWN